MAITFINPFISFPADTGGFDPDDYGTTYAWYDADQITGLSDNDPISSWSDSSGNGRTLTQGTSTLRPVYNTGVQNSLPVTTWDGGDSLINAGSASSQPWTVFIVCSADLASPTTNQFLFDSESSSSARCAGYTRDSSSDDFSVFAGSEQAARGYTTDPVILVFYFNGNSSYIRLNGSQSGNVAAGSNQWQPLTLGARFGDTEGWDGWIGEVIIYNQTITGTNISTIESELSTKWGITI